MYYQKSFQNLKILFSEYDKIDRNYSQAFQDMFVLSMLNGKRSGTFLEIGAFDPIEISNTYLLEKDFQWSGLAIDIELGVEDEFKKYRTCDFYTGDAVTADYKHLLRSTFSDLKRIDYLCIDIEPRSQTLECLKNLPLEDYRFSVITYETDFYSTESSIEDAIKIRNESRQILLDYGYLLIGKGIACSGPMDVFEDWYIDPTVIPEEIYSRVINTEEFNDSGERFLTKGPFVVATEFWDGQGLGNQLWAYAVTRAISEHRKMDFAIMGLDNFKGQNFISLGSGIKLSGGASPEGGPPTDLPTGLTNYRKEKKYLFDTTHWDISPMDQGLLNCPVNTKIDGNFQSVSYLSKAATDISSWIKIEGQEVEVPKNWCIIHVRGGDFVNLNPASLLQSFYVYSMKYIQSIDQDIVFKCVTDDERYAKSLLPDFVEVIGASQIGTIDSRQAAHHMGGPVEIDFKLLFSATYLIIPYSSFSWWATYLNSKKKIVVAPKYWALFGSKIKTWSTFDIATPGFTYIDENGCVFSYEECIAERETTKDQYLNKSVLEEKNKSILNNVYLKSFYSSILKYKIGKLIQRKMIRRKHSKYN
jgi:hypothetical protein